MPRAAVPPAAAPVPRHRRSSAFFYYYFSFCRCGHCKNAAGDVKAAAKMLKGVGNIAVVDGDKAGSATAQKLGVKGFPTFKLIVDGKATDYTGGRDAKSMVGAVMQAMGELMKTRMGGGGKPSSSSSSGGKPSGGKPSGGGGNAHGPSEPGGGKHVITGTADNFAAEVLNSVEPVLVEFYAPWCVLGGEVGRARRWGGFMRRCRLHKSVECGRRKALSVPHSRASLALHSCRVVARCCARHSSRGASAHVGCTHGAAVHSCGTTAHSAVR